MLWQLILGFYIAVGISLIAWWRKALDLSGAIAAVVAGTIIFGLGGLGPSVALVLFFLSGSVLSGLPSSLPRASLAQLEEKHGRSWKQVAANGAIPVAAILAAAIFPKLKPLFIFIYYGAVATSCSDTWGTELGVRFGKKVEDIVTGGPLSSGLSGGISFIGLTASVAGAVLIAAASAIPDGIALNSFFGIFVSGVLGSLADSILGSSLQGKYAGEAAEANSIRERHTHPILGYPMLIRGYHSVTNNGVNFLSSAFGASSAFIIFR